MKKYIKNIALIIFILSSGITYSQTVKLIEKFDSLNAESRGWKFINNDSSMMDFPILQAPITFTDAGLLSPYEGNYFIHYNMLNADDNKLIDEWIISPAVYIEKYDLLSFWCGAVDKSYKDTLRVLISETGTDVQDFVEIDRFKVDGPTTVWHEKTYDLSQFAGKTIYFALNYSIKNGGPLGANSDNVWIDNFSVKSSFGPEIQVETYDLEQNYPNPFNPVTNIIFSVPFDSDVTITIYDVIGKEAEVLVKKNYQAGRYKVLWNAANYASGTYFYQLSAVSGNNNFEDTKQMMLIR